MPGVPEAKYPGAVLAAARKAQGASVEDIARLLKLSVAQVKALEADDHSQLPAAVFVRGFLRSYARLLKVDIAALLPATTPAATPPDPRLMHHKPGVALEPRRKSSMPALAGTAACVLLGLAYYEFVFNTPPGEARISAGDPVREAPFEIAQAGTAGTSVSAVTVAAPTPGRPMMADNNLRLKKSDDPASGINEKGLHFQFNGESWVEVRGSDGKVVFSMVNAPGSERIVHGKPPFTLVIGGASGVQLSYNGSRVDLASYVTSDVARLRLE